MAAPDFDLCTTRFVLCFHHPHDSSVFDSAEVPLVAGIFKRTRGGASSPKSAGCADATPTPLAAPAPTPRTDDSTLGAILSMRAFHCEVYVVLLAWMTSATASAQIQFDDVTIAAGISYAGPSFGASWGDLDGDGLADLWVGNHAVAPPSLYLNNGDGTFTDVGAANWNGSLGDPHGASWVDFDRDGDQDLYESAGECCRSKLYVNEVGSLVDQAIAYGVDYPNGRGRTPTWFDVDRDGAVDLIIANATKPSDPTTVFRQIPGSPFEDVGGLWGISVAESSSVELSDQDGDGQLDLIFNGAQGPVSVQSPSGDPLVDISSEYPIPNSTSVRDIAVGDFDGDLIADFFYARTGSAFDLVQMDANTLVSQLVTSNEEQDFRFQSSGILSVELGPTSRQAPSSVFIGSGGTHPPALDFNLDPNDSSTWGIMPHTPGTVDAVFIGFDPPTQTWTFALSSITSGNIYLRIVSSELISNVDVVWIKNYVPLLGMLRILHHATGGYATYYYSEYPTACVSATTADFDNDMDLDVFMACTGAAANISNMLFENDGGGVFTPVPNAGGAAGSISGRSDVVVSADYDVDGYVDLFVTNGVGPLPLADGPHQLFRNVGGANNWLQIDLEGTVSSRDGIGARILLEAGGITQLREQGGGIHTHAQDYQRVHFGLGENTMADQITVYWPSGVVQVLTDIPANQVIRIVEELEAVPIPPELSSILSILLAAMGAVLLRRIRDEAKAAL
jgi:hypothetical protein